MDMWMMLKSLSPGMKYGEKADFSPEMPWVRRNFDQRFRYCTEQNAIDHTLVLQRKWSKQLREREHDMKVRNRQQLG